MPQFVVKNAQLLMAVTWVCLLQNCLAFLQKTGKERSFFNPTNISRAIFLCSQNAVETYYSVLLTTFPGHFNVILMSVCRPATQFLAFHTLLFSLLGLNKPVYLSQVTKTIVCKKPEIESLGDKRTSE